MILRPDQYIAWIGEMDDYDSMNQFFSGFMVDQRTRSGAKALVANGNPPKQASRKEQYSGTLAGTNGLRTNATSETKTAGDEAVAGVGGV